MGYAKIFSVREESLRQYVRVNGRDESFTAAVGRQVLTAALRPDILAQTRESEGDEPPDIEGCRSFHSTDFCLLFWSGDRLHTLPNADLAMFDSLLTLTKTVGTAHVVRSNYDELQHRPEGRGWTNLLEEGIHASIYWIYEDFTRQFEGKSEVEWPSVEVGKAALDLMLNSVLTSQPIENHGNALSRCCSFARPECAVLVWSLNCLRLLSEIEPEESERMRTYLTKE
ncbi:MAG: hypothetical protein HYV07_32660 [Deltaproteobacteria bacterium]|nr:hypothetical protein [Deltaproteobacteria bacterium]